MSSQPHLVKSLGLWWVRRDLRLADNEALQGAASSADALLPVFCLDPRDVVPRREAPEGLGVPKLGPLRCRFLLEGLAELDRDLRAFQPDDVSHRQSSDHQSRHCAPAPAAAGANTDAGSGDCSSDGGGGRGGGSSAGCSTGDSAAADCQNGGGGGGLVVRAGRPEIVLPRLLSRVYELNRELRHVSVHHHLDLMHDNVSVEAAVLEALRSWAARQGVGLSLHTYWDRTLYHPDDLPYHMYDKIKGPGPGADGEEQHRRRPEAARRPSGSAYPQRSALPPNRDPERFRAIPAVMTDFRKPTQAAASVRPSLPPPAALPPLPAPFVSNPSAANDSAAPAVAMAPQPAESLAAAAAVTAVPAAEPLWGIPCNVAGAYEAVGATPALRRLEALVGLNYEQLLGTGEAAAGAATADPAAPVSDLGPSPGVPASGPLNPRTAFPFHAGADSAARRLRYYVWGHEGGPESRPTGPPPSLLYFTNTRAQAVGVDNSTKLSPFVALGCMTPRQIHEEVDKVRAAAVAAKAAAPAPEAPGVPALGSAGATTSGVEEAASASVAPPAECDWLAMHLCIRDFFIFTALKEGEAMMDERGIVGRPVSWRRDEEAFSRWARGATGLPFVDANMRELAATGWMSNRGRQNVASLLTKDLGVDWRWGAELFECLLLDADVAVNYCNWNYFAGIGNDPRNRHFKTVTQGIQYDEDAVLAATWLPELSRLPPALRHQPWTMSDADAELYGVVIGRDYPHPLVDPAGHVGQLGLKGAKGVKRKGGGPRGKATA